MVFAPCVPSGLTQQGTTSVGFSDIPFRVFRNPQVAKGWLIDCWLQHQEDLGLVDAYEDVEPSSLG